MNDAVGSVCILVVFVVRKFMKHIVRNEHAAGHSNGEAGYVDKGVYFSPEEVTVGD
jgi:hypothetical protein